MCACCVCALARATEKFKFHTKTLGNISGKHAFFLGVFRLRKAQSRSGGTWRFSFAHGWSPATGPKPLPACLLAAAAREGFVEALPGKLLDRASRGARRGAAQINVQRPDWAFRPRAFVLTLLTP